MEYALKSFKRSDRLAALKVKKSQPSPHAVKLAAFVRGQLSAGKTLEQAFKQAERLNVGGCGE